MSRVEYSIVAIVLAIVGGCSKEDLNKALDSAKKTVAEQTEKVKQQVSDASSAAKEQLNLSGDAELVLDAPTKTAACYVQLVPAEGGRSAVLQFMSYKSADQEGYPSLFIQANVSVTNLRDLAGQSIQAQLWMQKEANGPVWSSKTPVEVKINSMDDTSMKAEVGGGMLKNTTDATEMPASGRLNAVLVK